MPLGITQGPDGKKFKFLTPSGATGTKASSIFIDLSREHVRMQTKESLTSDMQQLANCGRSPPFSLSGPTDCLFLLLWSVLYCQRDRVTLLIYNNHSKNNQKAMEKYPGGGNVKAQLSCLFSQPHKHTRAR